MIQDLLGDIPDPTTTTEAQKDQAARTLTERCGYAAAALTIIPLPGTEVVAVAPLHVALVIRIGQVYGAEVSRERALELVMRIGATAGLSLIGSKIATTAAKVLLPFAGGILIGAPFEFASTMAIGAVARSYFQNKGQLGDEEIKALYQESLKRARDVFDPRRARGEEARDLARAVVDEVETAPETPPEPAPAPDPIERLTRLKALLDKGLIEQAEYDEVKRRILEGI